jgi:hypothetical protein
MIGRRSRNEGPAGELLAARGDVLLPRPDSSVVERGPEKAGVGGSIPSLATKISVIYQLLTEVF